VKRSHDVVSIAQDLIRIDTTNPGDGTGPGERVATEYVAEFLSDLGFETVIRESAPTRTSLTALWEGEDRSRPPLVLHGHLDVVKAFDHEWRHPPFAAEVHDGMIWGRGAVDMKGTDAVYLETIARMVESGAKPARDIVIGFFADEEHGGRMGAQYMVENHPDDFRGATEAVSEVGGFSTQIAGTRAYLIQTAEKGLQWLRLSAVGTAAHGSLVHDDNAVTYLAEAIAKIGRYEWPLDITPTVEALLRGVAEIAGIEYEPTEEVVETLLANLGSAARFVEPTVRNTSNPTQLDAGYKANVIPNNAAGVVDTRPLFGQHEEVVAVVQELAGPNIKVEPIVSAIALEVPFSGPLVDAMIDSLHAEDPGAPVLPYALSGGTDNKHLSSIGITGYGFAPLQLPPELDFPALFHGVDERVPIASLEFGVRVMERFLRSC
jgi:acetylornithine deacetylase/succinyl-diaminopimelate desuccinylase-like protein